MNKETQTDCPTLSRDTEIARLKAENACLRRHLAHADRESQRARAESATADELLHCRRRMIQLQDYNQKLIRLTELLNSRLGVSTHKVTVETLRAARSIATLTPPSEAPVPAPNPP